MSNGTGTEYPELITYTISTDGIGSIVPPNLPIVAVGGTVKWIINHAGGSLANTGGRAEILSNPTPMGTLVKSMTTPTGWIIEINNANLGSFKFTVVVWKQSGVDSIAIMSILIVD